MFLLYWLCCHKQWSLMLWTYYQYYFEIHKIFSPFITNNFPHKNKKKKSTINKIDNKTGTSSQYIRKQTKLLLIFLVEFFILVNDSLFYH